jgi:hypothetical protein
VSKLAFDRVMHTEAGTQICWSAGQFLALPLEVRVHAVLSGSLLFYLGGVAVERRVALASLRAR